LFFNNLIDLVLARYKADKKYQEETKGAEGKLTPAERDYVLLEYNTTLDNISNFADTAIQFGFATLFISALPIASFLSLVSNYVKVKMLAWKLCKFYQRPIPIGAQDIGTWLTIFQFIAVVSVITNAGLICFTMTTLNEYTALGRTWVFIGFQWALITMQFISEQAIPDEPEEALIQIERMEFICSKLIEQELDDEEIKVKDYQLEQQMKKTGAGKGPKAVDAISAVASDDRQSIYSQVFGSQLQTGYIKQRHIHNCDEIKVDSYPTATATGSSASMTANPMQSPVR